MKILLYGSTGWLGSRLLKLLENDKHTVIPAKARLDNFIQLIQELNSFKNLDMIVMAAGLTGRPNVDWCEDHRDEVISVNIIGTSIVTKFCYNHQIHFTFLGTGCIYEYDKTHTPSTKGYTEKDLPNYAGSFYSYTKIMIQNIITEYNGLILRIRMPISDDLHPRNFITKITKYKRVVNVPNSMTVLHDMIPLIPDMIKRKLTGTYNFTNGGNISHNQILDLYTKYIDPNFKYQNFSLEDQSKILKAGRSNNTMDNSKLKKLYPNLPDIMTSIDGVFKRMQKNIEK